MRSARELALGPIQNLSTFAAALRNRGMTVTPDQVGDMARAITLVDASRRRQVHAALRSLAVTEPDQRGPFDEEFARFFDQLGLRPSGEKQETSLAAVTAMKPVLQPIGELPSEEALSRSGASASERLAARDFADLDEDQLMEARRLVLAMMWQPSDVKTRRWQPSRRGSSPDLRRTLRGSVRPEGDLMPIVHRQRRRRQRPLIVIADISGSMEKYADLFLVFAHAAQRRLDDVEVFTFSTRLTRITEDLKRRDTRAALARVSTSVSDWSGGTKIGEALAEWNRQWSRRLSRGGPIALILSDGWDCGDPEVLGIEIARLARSVHRILWLNPLAARADYRPATRGMQTVLPYVDHLLPAASVVDLKDVVRLLDTLNAARA
ncbi:MAG TPA: VWA domain-containing protein [Acidimicrobiia bacterium]|nr:VWA domain-containing protein [Acidimicrobiia bacterium]